MMKVETNLLNISISAYFSDMKNSDTLKYIKFKFYLVVR